MLVALIGVTRYKARKAFLKLPHQLGVDITSSTDSFTYSQTVKGRVIFTIHAAKAFQHKNGITTLRDVAVTLYGPPGSNRTDSIRGAEFEYDQKNGVVRAMGDTLLDIAAPGNESAGDAKAKRITMQGRGLVFLQKLGVASTTEMIRFQYGASQGTAVGADYEIDTGVLTLQHDVHLLSNENGHAERIDADAAMIDRNTRKATLRNGTLQDAADSMRAPMIVAALRSSSDAHSGSLENVHATGGVMLRTAGGEQVQAPELDAKLSAQNQLELVTMQGGMRLQDATNTAAAQRGVLRFQAGKAEHLTLTGQAHVDQRASAMQSRTLDAAQIEAALEDGGGHVALTSMHATGAAKMTLVQPAAQAGRVQRTELSAPVLDAAAVPVMVRGVRSSRVRSLEAQSGALLLQDDGAGSVRTSTGDHLTATFAAGANDGSAEVENVVQEGHVTIHETQAAMPAQGGKAARAATETEAHAARAEFVASTNLLTLTGSPEVKGEGVQLAAERLVLHRDSGDADASGAVRGRIVQQAKQGTRGEPTSFAAESAHMIHSTGRVLLEGGGSDARLWAAAGQVEAPRIEADQRAGTLHAFGAAMPGGVAASAATVKMVLVQQGTAAGSIAALGPGASHAGTAQAMVTRVFSRELVYRSGTQGQPGSAEFRGGVRLLQGADVITADAAIAVVQAGQALGGGVQSITADGHVRMVQGDQTATGSRLVYTASDRRAVLTGAPGAPPVLRDPAQGTVTGTQVVVRLGEAGTKGDNQIEVVGAAGSPVHTEFDVPERGAATSSRSRSRKPR